MDQTPSTFPTYLAAILRTIGATVGGWLIAKGYITADQAPAIGGGVLALIVVVWSLVQKANSHAALRQAIAAPAGKAT